MYNVFAPCAQAIGRQLLICSSPLFYTYRMSLCQVDTYIAAVQHAGNAAEDQHVYRYNANGMPLWYQQ